MAWWKRISRRLVAPRKKARPGFETLEERATPAGISLVSVGLPTTQGDGVSSLTSSRGASFSADGRYFVFYSEADNLTAGDTNQAGDIFREDLQTGTLALVSTDAAGDPATDGANPSGSFDPSISADGRFVAFMSYANNLVANDANATPDIFVKDMQTGAVSLVSTDASGNQLSGFSFYPAISADGNSVAFVEFTTNGTGGQTSDVYVKNLVTGSLTLASASAADGTQGDGPSTHPAISADGTIVAFSSTADNLVSATSTGGGDIFEKNLTTGAVTLVSATSAGVGGDGASDNPTLSSDGTKVAFDSTSDNLVAGDQNQVGDVFVVNLSTSTTTRVSTDSAGGEADGVSYDAHLTPDGTQVLFTSAADNLVSNDTNTQPDVFLKNLSTGAIARVDTASDESQASDGASAGTISPAGDKVAFASDSDNFVAGDDNALSDVFVKTIASGTTVAVSTGSSVNIGATGDSTLTNSSTQVSDDGRFFVYTSGASNLVAGNDANGSATDVYWYDSQTGQTVRVSSADDGTQGDKASSNASISGDGSIVAFQSDADNLVAGDTNNATDVFIENPPSGQIALLSQSQTGDIGNGPSYDVSLTRDFQYAVFVTKATNLFADQQPDFSDIVVEDLLTGVITLVSADASGHQGAGDATDPSISDDGRYVTFLSNAPDLLPGDDSGQTDVYVKDLTTGTLTRVSVGTGGAAPDGASTEAQISGDGSTIVFASSADNLVDGDTNGVADIFVANRTTGAITRVSKAGDGTPGNSVSENPSISDDGRYVAFASYSNNLVDGDTNQHEDVFVADLQAGTMTLVSQGTGGIGADGASNLPTINGTGRAVAFTSQATNLVAGDTSAFSNVFVDQINAAPNIVLNIPTSIDEGDGITLDASGTTDPDGDPLTFSWDLNGDGVYGDATGAVVNLTWQQLQSFGFDDGPGFRSINLQVTDAFGPITQPIQIAINDTAPTGTIVPGTFSPVMGQSATFSSTVTDPSATDTSAGFTYSWAATVNGTPIAANATTTSPAFSLPLASSGAYDVTLTVTDKDGGASTSDYTFTVAGSSTAAPVVSLAAAPATGTAGTPISFAGNVTAAAGQNGLNVVWSVTKNGQAFASGNGTTVSFTPDAAASYVVTMSATDINNAVGTGTATIAVTAANVQNPTLTLNGASTFTPGSSYSLAFTNVVAGTNAITGYAINWGDGTTGTFNGSPTNQTHTYAVGQTAETISITVTTSAGTFPVGTKALTAAAAGTAPVIDMSAAPSDAIPGDEIDFTVVSTAPNVTFAWTVTFNGSTFASGTGAEIDFTANDTGNYVVSISATDTLGTGTASKTISVSNQVFPPIVDLSAAPTTVAPGTLVDFIASATTSSTSGTPLTFTWTVHKDGAVFASGTGTEISFTPDTDDNYNVTVNATDDTGTGSTTATIVAGDSNTQINPSLSLTGPSTFTPGVVYSLGFTNIDAGSNAITSYSIDWGDGTVIGGNGAPPATKTHTFTGSATARTINVTVQTSVGNFLVGTKSLLEVDSPPTSTLTGSATVSLNVLYTLQIAPVTDSDGVTVTNWTIHWGDGTPDSTGTGLPPTSLTHTYTAAGAYTVSLDLTDATGPEPGIAFAGVTVNAASGSTGPSFLSGDTTTLTGTGAFTRTVSFTDPSGGTFTGTVDYGDGNGPHTLSINSNASTFGLSDVYAANGTYTVTVSLSDGTTSSTGTYTVVVSGLGATPTAPVVNLGGNASLLSGGMLTQNDTITDNGPGPLTATVDYGDGSGPQTLTVTGGSFTLNHTYTQAGTYTVTVTATDNGLTGTSTISALVQSAQSQSPPVVGFPSDAIANSGLSLTLTGTVTDTGPGPLTATVDYGDGTGPQTLAVTAGNVTLNHTYAQAGTYNIVVTATDNGLAGNFSISALIQNTQTQTPPIINVNSGVTNGLVFTQPGTITDNGPGPLAATVDYGDGSGPQTLVVTAGSFTLSHTYAQVGSYTVTLTAADNGFTGTSTITALVQAAQAQTPPIVNLGNSASATTGLVFTQSGTIADNGPGPLAATVDYGDGSGPHAITVTGGNFTLSHTYTQAGTYVITVAAADNGFTGSSSIGVLVVDQVSPPTVGLPGNVAATAGTAFTQSGTIADSGPGPLTATVDYGDGTGPHALTVSAGSFTLSHSYALPGTYTVTVTATDNGQTGTATLSAVVQAAQVTPNDNFTDITSQDSSGVWHIARSTGTSFVDMNFGSLFNPTQTWIDVLAADFTGDGRTDLAAMNAATGQWYVAVDTGVSFTVTNWDAWSPTVSWSNVTAVDLDHDGKFDIVGINPATGSVQASLSLGDHGTTSVLGALPTNTTYVDLQWADVDGDHRPDLVGRVGDQVSTWFNVAVPGAVGSSAELVSASNPWGTLTPGSGSSGSGSSGSGSSGTGDNGSGNSGSGGSTSGSGVTPVTPVTPTTPVYRRLTWNVPTPPTPAPAAVQSNAAQATTTQTTTTQSTSTATAPITTTPTQTTTSTSSTTTTTTTAAPVFTGFRHVLTWNFMPATTTTPPPSNPSTTQSFSQMLLGDVDGDGKADVVALSSTTNQWTVALSQGTTLGPATVWAGLSTTETWNYAALVDLNGDGKKDLLLRSNSDGTWWAAYSTGTGFNVVFLGATDPGVLYSDVVTGDFNGDGKTDVAFRRANGQIVVGISTGTGMTFSAWDTIDPASTNVNSGLFA